jgi:hypothetical protein
MLKAWRVNRSLNKLIISGSEPVEAASTFFYRPSEQKSARQSNEAMDKVVNYHVMDRIQAVLLPTFKEKAS